MSWLPTDEQAAADLERLRLYPGRRRANDPRSGVTDAVSVFDRPGPLGIRFWVVRLMRVLPFPEFDLFVDPRRDGFLELEHARGWIRQEYPYATACVLRGLTDDPEVLETWL